MELQIVLIWYQSNFTCLLFLNMLSALHYEILLFGDMTLQKWVVTFWTPCRLDWSNRGKIYLKAKFI